MVHFVLMPATKRHDDLSILIPAAGTGSRLGRGPKALVQLQEKPLITWVSEKVLGLSDEVLVAVPEEHEDSIARACPGCRCIRGGATRQDSVDRLLQHASRDWVLLADVARPFISLDLYNAVYEAARKSNAAGAFLTPDVPVAEIRDNRLIRTLRNNEVGLFQLPHGFSRSLLLDVYDRTRKEGWQEQSTLELVLRAGHDVAVVQGEKSNLKLTSVDDWRHAQLLTEHLS